MDAAPQAQPQPEAGGCIRPWTLGPELIAGQIVRNVHVPVSTVLELSGTPGSLDRYGPVSAEHIRLLRPTALRRVLVDGLTGRPLAVDDRPTQSGPTRRPCEHRSSRCSPPPSWSTPTNRNTTRPPGWPG